MFLHLLLLRGRKSTKEAIPVKRYECSVNINGSFYNISEYKDSIFKFTEGESTYYGKICGSLNNEDINNSNISLPSGVNGIVMDENLQTFEPIGFLATQDFTYSISSQPERGVVMYTKAPRKDKKHPYYKLVFEFAINKSSDTDHLVSNITFFSDDCLNVVFYFETSLVTYNKTEKPEPDVVPDTVELEYDSTIVYPYTVDFTLNDLETSYHGYPITRQLDDSFILYQPLTNSTCPLGYDCDFYSKSLMWHCKNNSCKSLADSFHDLSLLYEDPDEGLIARYTLYGDISASVELVCDFDLPKNTTYFDKVDTTSDHVLIRAHTSNVCFKINNKGNDKGFCRKKLVDDKLYIDFDLTKYYSDDGFRIQHEFSMTKKEWVTIQPCDALPCPGDSCPNSTGGTIWHCEEDENNFSNCTSYGLYKYFPEIQSLNGKIENGVLVSYRGIDDKNATITVVCDPDADAGSLRFDEFHIEGSELKIHAYSSDVCLDLYPSSPRERETSPDVGILKPILRAYNGNRSIVFDTRNIEFSLKKLNLYENGKMGSFHVEASIFSKLSAPLVWRYYPVSSETDMWGCFSSKVRSDPICYSLSSVFEYGYYYEYLSDLSAVALKLESAYFDLTTFLNLSCSDDDFALEDDADLYVNTFVLSAKSINACTQEDHQPVIPEYTPTPIPSKSAHSTTYKSNGKYYDLKDIHYLEEIVKIIADDEPQIVDILLDLESQITCPEDAYCHGSSSANAFKCWYDHTNLSRICLPIADLRQAPVLASDYSIIEGGYSNYRLNLSLVCSNSTSFKMDRDAIETNKTISATVRGPDFCPGFQPDSSSNSTLELILVFSLLIPLAIFCLFMIARYISGYESVIPQKCMACCSRHKDYQSI